MRWCIHLGPWPLVAICVGASPKKAPKHLKGSGEIPISTAVRADLELNQLITFNNFNQSIASELSETDTPKYQSRIGAYSDDID